MKRLGFLLAALAAALVPARASARADIVIVNGDSANEGFNDLAPAAPVGGNPATTLGAQRLKAFEYAARLWAETIDSPVQIRIRATFDPLTCMVDSAVLGSASASGFQQNFTGAPLPNVRYPNALADRIAGRDLTPAAADITARFNSSLGTAGCLPDSGWYLGFDRNTGIKNDLVTVLLHEFGHGLGFATQSHQTGLMDVFGYYLLDAPSGKRWPSLTQIERQTSGISGKLVWDGPLVRASVPARLGYPARFSVTAPASLARTYAIAEANFGPRLSSITLTGEVQLSVDAAGQSTGCVEPLQPLTGKIALLDRGGGMTCLLTDKSRRAMQAGAVGVIIANNVPDAIPGAFGTPDPTLTIPGVLVSQADGAAIKTALQAGPVSIEIRADTTARAGADSENRAQLFAPMMFQAGSSVSHFDVSASPNLLMEPFINIDLLHDVDLTLPLFRDLGWAPDADLDGVLDARDNCAYLANPNQADADGDGLGDACEGPDGDSDGVPDAQDNCAMLPNPKQHDADGDGAGDACEDSDSDGVLDGQDNCARVANASQADTDANGRGDACEDADGDGILNGFDNCPLRFNPTQADADGDGVADACEEAPLGVADAGDPGDPNTDAGTGVGGGGGEDASDKSKDMGAGGCAFGGPVALPGISLLALFTLALRLGRRRIPQ